MLKEKVYSILVSLLLATVGIYAQTPTATLSGVVRDERKGVIPKATVKVTHIATGKTRTISTDAAGRYSFTNLEPGSYEALISSICSTGLISGTSTRSTAAPV
jgi:hypothetical protein